MRKKNHVANYIWIILLGLALIFFVEYAGFFRGFNDYNYDLFFRFRGERLPWKDIIIISIDETSLSKLGRWPIQRSYYTELLGVLKKARAVGLDIILSEPTHDDAELGRAIEKHGRVVLPVYINNHRGTSTPVDDFSAAKRGHIHLEQDVDGIVRGVFHMITFDGQPLPSFALALYRLADPSACAEYEALQKRNPSQSDTNLILQNDLMMINYYGPRNSFPCHSLSDVLGGIWPPSFYKDKIVLVGLTSPGVEDSVLTPFTQERNQMPGVEAHAHILNNLLDKSDISIVPQGIRWVTVVVLSFLFFSLFSQMPVDRAAYLWLVILLCITVANFILFKGAGTWFAPASFYSSFVFVFTLAYIKSLKMMTSELKTAKEDWEDSFNTIDDAITIHDSECRLLRSNRVAMEGFGEPLLKMLAKRCRQLSIEEEKLSDTAEQDERYGKEGTIEEIYVPELERHVEIKTIPRWDRDSRFEGVMHVVRDITQKIQTEKEQQDLQFHLIRAQKMEALGTLAGSIAHDFNNILSAILGYTELAELEIPEGNKAHGQLHQVRQGGERAKELVKQILTFSRQTGSEKKPIEIGPIVKETLKLIRSAIPSTVQIRSDIQGECSVIGDPTQMHQVIMNLCTNAYQAMRNNGGILSVTVDVQTFESDSVPSDLNPGPYVRIRIRDTGPGIPPEVVGRIFDPYFTTKEKGEGTGLGLSVVQGIVQVHGGMITVDSRPREGCTFTVLLPEIEQETNEEIKPREELPKGTERILLVDDEAPLVQLWRDMLERLGYIVTAKQDSLDALETFRNAPDRYDLVITDMTMPNMRGDELSRELMNTKPNVPIILCTGFNELITEDKARQMGIRAFVMKPIVMEEIANTIRRVLET